MSKNLEKEIYSVVGKRIREERKNKGLTQEELAEKADMNYKFLNRIERNVSKPSLDMIIKLAEVLDVSFLSLFGNAKSKNNKSQNDKQLLANKFNYLFSSLPSKWQQYIIKTIKEIKKILK